MEYDYFDYTQNYNFSQELNERMQFSNDGTVIGEVDLDDDFFAELVENGGVSGTSDRITVWLCHRGHKEKIYAFTIMAGIMLHERDTLMRNVVKMKFSTNYANLKEVYRRRYCNTKRKITKKVSVKD